MIDIEKAKSAFEKYIKNYNAEDGKIALKINHIYRVAEISRDIAIMNKFKDEEQKLAELIGLLHDIGRFEQIRIYNTFNDNKSINHAEMAIKVLFKDGLIRDFITQTDYDEIIKIAILNHNKGRIDENVAEKILPFCKVIRDADKVDIFYVLNEDKFENTYEKADISNEMISDEIYREFKEDRIIDYKKIKSAADIMVSHFAYIYDFNYGYCLNKIKQEKYLQKLYEKANYKNEDTITKMDEIIEIANMYTDEKLKKLN